LAVTCLVLAAGIAAAEDFRAVDAYWVLLHEPAAVAELKLTSAQRPRYQELLDSFDLRFFPYRNKPREEAEAGVTKLVDEVRAEMRDLLTARQQERLSQLTLRRLGMSSMLQADVVAALKYTTAQRTKIETLLGDLQTSLADLEKRVQAGETREPLDKKYKDVQATAQKKLLQTLKPAQQTTWQALLGPDVDPGKYGQPVYKVPELITTDGWINSNGLKLADLRGKVVVVHFYACGCINCIRNYPWYRAWHEKFPPEDFVLIGIHSPETSAEHNLDHVRQKATEEQLNFPILLDDKSANWKAWGNSMWPSVYVIDRDGYLRHFWPGELNWQGNNGEKVMRERIETLLKKKAR